MECFARIKALESVCTQAEIARDDYKLKLNRAKTTVADQNDASDMARSQFAELDAKYNALISPAKWT